MIRRDEAVVSVLKIWLERDHGLLCHVSDLLHEKSHILSSIYQVFDNACKQLLGALLVGRELLTRRLESLRVLVEREVRQVHVMIFDVMRVGLLVVVRTEACETFVAEVSLYGVDAANQHVQPAIKLLLVQNERIVNVALHEVLVMER